MKGLTYFTKECLWCYKQYRGLDRGYCFCNNCISKLEDIENITGDPSITGKLESYLKGAK